MNSSHGHHQDYLHKKERKGKWVLFWVILNGKHMLFYESKKSQQLVGSIQIGGNTKCVVTKTKTFNYPFTVCATHGRHLFKCQTSVQRHHWMAAVDHASRLLKSSPSPVSAHLNQTVLDEMPCYEATEENHSVSDDQSPDDPLPSNVLRVTALSPDSPSLPFRARDRTELTDDGNADEDKPDIDIASKATVSLFPYARQSNESPHVISEREQISALNLSSHSPLDVLNPPCATDSSGSTRNRSFASTPDMDKHSYLVSPQSLSTSRSKASCNFIPSSDSSCASNVRFSRHMVSGNDFSDMEI